MGRIERFEDIVAWQKARSLNKKIYLITGKADFSRDYDLARQIRRASISITSNIAEGFERGRTKEFLYFLNVAKASAAEVRSQLYVANDLDYISEEKAKELLADITEISRMVSGLMKYLNNQSPNEVRELDGIYNSEVNTFHLSHFNTL